MAGPFRVLFVCTGNICRSAVAERLLRSGLAERLGDVDADAFGIEVSSAGVRALAGQGIDPPSADALLARGGDPDGFAARQLEADMLAEADLVLVATRRHRATTARLLHSSVTRTFTIREFNRLVQLVDVTALPDAEPADRLRKVVREAAALRGMAHKEGPGGDDVADPYGRPPAAHEEAASLLTSTLAPITDVLVAAAAPVHVDAAVDAASRRKQVAQEHEIATERARLLAVTRRKTRLIALVGIAVLVVSLSVLMLWQGLAAKRELEAAKPDVTRIRTALVSGEAGRTRIAMGDLQSHTGAARRNLAGPWWAVAEALPFIGDDIAAVRTVSRTVDTLAQTVLPPLVEVADTLGPEDLRISGDQIALAPLQDAAPRLELAAEGVAAADQTLAATSPEDVIGPVRSALTDLSTQVDQLTDLTREAAATARLVPQLLGADGPRRYFLAFQNNAEARGTGGLLGAYGILEADNGKLSVTELGNNQDLENAPTLPVDLGPDFAKLYGEAPRLWVNSNVSPHFPYAARIWMELWRLQHGERLDGVIATDPVALGYVLDAIGPVRVPGGTVVTGANAAEMTMSDVYRRFPSARDNALRDSYLQRMAGAVVDKALSGAGDPRRLVASLGKAVSERRLLVFSRHQDVQSGLLPFAVSGVVPDDAAPYFAAAINSAVPSKLDYYLERSISYLSDTCTSTNRRGRVTLTMTNSAPARGLPNYVALPPRQRKVPALRNAPVGTNYVFVDLIVPAGSGFDRATIDGKQVGAAVSRQRGHPVFSFHITLEPGQKRTIVMDLLQPRSDLPLVIDPLPLVLPLAVSQEQKNC